MPGDRVVPAEAVGREDIERDDGGSTSMARRRSGNPATAGLLVRGVAATLMSCPTAPWITPPVVPLPILPKSERIPAAGPTGSFAVPDGDHSGLPDLVRADIEGPDGPTANDCAAGPAIERSTTGPRVNRRSGSAGPDCDDDRAAGCTSGSAVSARDVAAREACVAGGAVELPGSVHTLCGATGSDRDGACCPATGITGAPGFTADCAMGSGAAAAADDGGNAIAAGSAATIRASLDPSVPDGMGDLLIQVAGTCASWSGPQGGDERVGPPSEELDGDDAAGHPFGNALDLYVSRALMRAHGGDIVLGAGPASVMRLPAARLVPVPPSPQGNAEAHRPLHLSR